jgi:hypothetical protein
MISKLARINVIQQVIMIQAQAHVNNALKDAQTVQAGLIVSHAILLNTHYKHMVAV